MCRYGKSSGAIAESDDSRSAGTSGSAFSLIESEADVCWMNTCNRPAQNLLQFGQRGEQLFGDEMESSRPPR